MTKLHRRRFLQGSLLLVGGASKVACAPSVEPTAKLPEGPPKRVVATVEPQAEEVLPGFFVGNLAEVPPGKAKIAAYRGQPVVVANDDGRIRVLSGTCTHENCEVEWRADLSLIQCPCHDGRYDLRGQVLSGPPPTPLWEFEAQLVDGKIYIITRESG